MNFTRWCAKLAAFPIRYAAHAITHPTDLHLRIRTADIRPSVAADQWDAR